MPEQYQYEQQEYGYEQYNDPVEEIELAQVEQPKSTILGYVGFIATLLCFLVGWAGLFVLCVQSVDWEAYIMTTVSMLIGFFIESLIADKINPQNLFVSIIRYLVTAFWVVLYGIMILGLTVMGFEDISVFNIVPIAFYGFMCYLLIKSIKKYKRRK